MGWGGGGQGSWGQTEFNLSYEKENEVEAESAMQHFAAVKADKREIHSKHLRAH